jgi:GNAT superfamily N-acetyltransferase
LTAELLNSSDLRAYSLQQAIKESIVLSNFECEEEFFTKYLRDEACLDDRDNIGRVIIFTTLQQDLVGFVTVAMSEIRRLQHKRLQTITTIHSYVPGLLLGHMARHIKYKRKGVGILMRDWVINHALELSKSVGCRLVILQAFNERVAKIYEEWGFVRVDDFDETGRHKMFVDLAWRGKSKNQ